MGFISFDTLEIIRHGGQYFCCLISHTQQHEIVETFCFAMLHLCPTSEGNARPINSVHTDVIEMLINMEKVEMRDFLCVQRLNVSLAAAQEAHWDFYVE